MSDEHTDPNEPQGTDEPQGARQGAKAAGAQQRPAGETGWATEEPRPEGAEGVAPVAGAHGAEGTPDAEDAEGAMAEAPERGRRSWLAPVLAGGLVLVVAAGLGGWALGHWQGTRSTEQAQAAHIVGPGRAMQDFDDLPRRIENDPFAVGEVDAPVVISEFSDFECPYCAKYANETEQQILDEYVATGKVRIEWNDMPINGEKAHLAAEAGRAAAAQGRFQEFKDVLYEASKDVEGHPDNDIDDLVGFAEKASVPDIDRFRSEIEDGTYGADVDRAMAIGTVLGVNGTPTFVVGEQPMSGAQPFEEFKKAIDAELDKK